MTRRSDITGNTSSPAQIAALLLLMAASATVRDAFGEPQTLKRVRVGKLKVDLKRLLGLHPCLERLVLRFMVCHLQGDLRRLTFRHIQELEDLVLRRPMNSIVDLPKGISVIKKKTYLQFLKNKS